MMKPLLKGPDKFGLLLGGLAFLAMVGYAIVRAWPVPTSDLEAQRSMANAGWAMVWMTGASIVVGGLSIYLIARTLIEAQRSANASEAAVSEARANTLATERIGRAQVKAYLGIRSVVLSHSGAGWLVRVTVHNAGQSPARAVNITVTCPGIDTYWNSLAGVRFTPAEREGIGTSETEEIEFEATAPPPSIDDLFHGVIDVEIDYLDVFNGMDTIDRSFVLEPRFRMFEEYEMRPYTHTGATQMLPAPHT